MPPWLRHLGLALAAGPVLLLWAFPGIFSWLFAPTLTPPAVPTAPPAPRRALPNPERCLVIETVPGWIDIDFAVPVGVPTAGRHVRWWCDDDRVYWD